MWCRGRLEDAGCLEGVLVGLWGGWLEEVGKGYRGGGGRYQCQRRVLHAGYRKVARGEGVDGDERGR